MTKKNYSVMEVNHSNLPQAIELLFSELREIKSFIQAPKNEENQNERLTRKQVRDTYKICFGTIHNLMKSGKLSYEKVGRKTVFKKSDVEQCFSNKN